MFGSPQRRPGEIGSRFHPSTMVLTYGAGRAGKERKAERPQIRL